jgi:hypothetical protein
MATAQGIVKFSGVPIARCFYTAYYKSNNGGSAGPGAGQRSSQWASGVFLTEDSGLYSISCSADFFLGAAATVANGDQIVIIFWRLSTALPSQAGGSFFSGQSRTDGSGGTHARGFKSNNGAAVNYAASDFVRSVTFTMTGNAWNATPGAVGGNADGNIDLLLNGAPVAALSGASTDQANPTAITRGVAAAFTNVSSDDVANKLFTFNGQILLEAMSAAHNPGDGTSVEGSRYDFYQGLVHGRSFGTPAGGDANGTSFSTYAGPLFKSHSHTFPAIDVYRVTLTVRDDSEPSVTDTKNYYFKTFYRTPTFSIGARKWCSWSQYASNPQAANASFSASNPNTVNDVMTAALTVTDPDASAGSPAAARKMSGAVTLSGGVQTINQTGIGIGAMVGSFFCLLTQNGANARKSFKVSACSADSVTIDATGDTSTLSTRDWYTYAAEPTAGTATAWDWEIDTGTGYSRIGMPAVAAFPSNVVGLTVHIPGIGQNVLPGWNLSIIDGAGRGTVRITAVNNDDEIVVATAISASAGDHYEIGCRNALSAVYAQDALGTLNLRVTGTYSNGWVFSTAVTAAIQTGSVNNIPPQAVVSKDSTAGSSTTYNFDGRKSYGTQTAWVQDSAFLLSHQLDGLATFDITDPMINTSGLRDGHAWITLLDSFGVITHVFKIVDVDRESPAPTVATIATNGSVLRIEAGTRFRTTNVYEIDGSDSDNNIAGYAWDLRSADPAETMPALPTSHADFAARFSRVDGSGAGSQWAYTYSQTDVDRWACVELTVTDAHGATNVTWQLFKVSITQQPTTVDRPRRIEWE